MRSIGWLALGMAAVVMPPAARADDKPALSRPNILFVFTDDQSWRTLSCYKDDGAWPWVKTPHIDRLAAEGVRFTHAYGSAWCAPSRACVLTGLHLHAIQGLRATDVHKAKYDPAVCRFWPAELRKAGYDTALIGKWHLSADAGHGRDWDYSVVWDQGQSRGDQYTDQFMSVNGRPRIEMPGYSTDLYTEFALAYLKQEHKKPWLLWLCYNAPHMEWAVHPRHKDRYRDSEVPIPVDIFGPRKDKPRYLQDFTQWQRGIRADDPVPIHTRTKLPFPDMVRNYNRTICAVDEGIGRIYDALQKSGQLDNTLIVFTSDQGFAWGDHGFSTKVGPYDACMRIPLIVRLPGIAAKGLVCRQPAALIDLPPTFFPLAGQATPWPMHGRDLRPLLKDPQGAAGHPVVLEHFRWEYGPETDRGITADAAQFGIPWWIFLRQGKHKYIRTLLEDEIEELYDLEADPQELKNLAVAKDQQPLVADYRRRLLAELERTGAGLVKNLPKPRTAH